MSIFGDALEIRESNRPRDPLPKIVPITTKVRLPLTGKALDDYVELHIQVEKLSDEIFVLERKLALARIKKASADLKLQIIDRSRA